MPVYLVDVNRYRRDGIRAALPELQGIAPYGAGNEDDAATWAVSDLSPSEIRDVTVELLSTRDDCWTCEGPETLN